MISDVLNRLEMAMAKAIAKGQPTPSDVHQGTGKHLSADYVHKPGRGGSVRRRKKKKVEEKPKRIVSDVKDVWKYNPNHDKNGRFARSNGRPSALHPSLHKMPTQKQIAALRNLAAKAHSKGDHAEVRRINDELAYLSQRQS